MKAEDTLGCVTAFIFTSLMCHHINIINKIKKKIINVWCEQGSWCVSHCSLYWNTILYSTLWTNNTVVLNEHTGSIVCLFRIPLIRAWNVWAFANSKLLPKSSFSLWTLFLIIYTLWFWYFIIIIFLNIFINKNCTIIVNQLKYRWHLIYCLTS